MKFLRKLYQIRTKQTEHMRLKHRGGRTFKLKLEKMTVRRNIVSWLIQILALLHIIPNRKSRLADWLGCFIWLLTQVVMFSIYFYFDAKRVVLDLWIEDLSLKSTLFFLASPVRNAFHNFGIILALTNPWKRYSLGALDIRFKAPRALPILLTNAVLQVLGVYFSLGTKRMEGIMSPIYISYTLLSMVALFIIGVSGGQVSNDNLEKIIDIQSAVHIVTSEISRFKALKCFLSPLLVVLLVTNGTTFFSFSYVMFTNPSADKVSVLLIILISLTNITYTCAVVDKCFEKYVSTAATLRYITLFAIFYYPLLKIE